MCPAYYVASDQVWVVALERGRIEHAAREDAIAKTWGEAFHLLLDSLAHVDCGSVRDVAVGPGGVVAFGSAGGIEQAGLDQDDERALDDFSAPGRAFAERDFFHGAAEVNRCGVAALGRAPGDGRTEGPVHLECSGAVAIARELRSEWRGEPAGGDREQLARSDVAESQRVSRDFGERRDAGVRDDAAA
jgi:hypothetical protein